ncbi:hypothetical protein KIN20_015960 [Parelaphostrongylus tenuis]|uniref:Uncharacterized protein n=1 Tax=Parelaphostrongylus tenuis TaxID=148309 RepID=A0AAD5MFR9_PARTN|nr:hypothetical protein KIN20_015960 [Parelaphostrongylus tenuis]
MVSTQMSPNEKGAKWKCASSNSLIIALFNFRLSQVGVKVAPTQHQTVCSILSFENLKLYLTLPYED